MIWYALGVITGLLIAVLNVLLYKKTRVVQALENRIKPMLSRQATIIEPDFLDTLGV